jgi:glycosyltransferase involved in cell wall biosynthesis
MHNTSPTASGTEAKPLTIAHLLQWFDLGGGESVALQLATKQVAAGHRVLAVALTREQGPLADAFRDRGVAIHAVSRRREGYDPTLYASLFSLLARLRPDVVHSHHPQSLVYAAPPAKLLRRAVVHTKHGVDIDTPRRLWLIRGTTLFVDALVAVSEETATIARDKREIASHRLRVIENGIDLDRFVADEKARRATRAELGIPDDAWVVGTVGRLEPVKNHALLLRAMAPLCRSGAHLILVGDGGERDRLSELSRELPGGPGMHLLGMRRDIPRLLQAMDAFAISSDSEGLPLALLEAMAASLPVVCTAVGGIVSVLEDGVTGLLVPAGDEKALANQLQRLRDDGALATALGEAASELARQRYSLDRTVDRYEQLYRELLGGRRG